MTVCNTIIAIAVSLLLGIAIGRYSLPAKVVTQVKTVEVEKQVTATDLVDHSVVQTVETKAPDGSVTTTTVTHKDVDTLIKQATKDVKDSETTKQVVYNTQSLGINVLAGIQDPLKSAQVLYGAQIEHKLIGPINVGLFGFTDGRVGVSVGLRF